MTDTTYSHPRGSHPQAQSLDRTVRPSRTALHRVVATGSDVVPLLLRLTLAAVIFPHGAQKVLGWFGGYGFEGTLGYFTGTLGVPAALAVLVFGAELLGPIGLALGAFGRVAAAGIIAVMTGAVAMVHLENGFFMNWTGAQAGEGFEYHLLAVGLALAVVIAGSGRWSVDRWLAERL